MKRTLPVICALALSVPAQAVAAPVDFELSPGARAVSAAGGGDVISKPLRTPRRFDLVGFRWARGGEPDIDVRTRRPGGRWTPWVHAAAHADHAPDPAGREPGGAGASDPVWAGRSRWVQYRLSRRLSRLRLHFVSTAGARIPKGPRAVSAQASGQPAIVPRSGWGAQDCPPRRAASYGEVRAAFVHHTVSTNNYTPEQAPSVVLAICRYHRNSNGWDDVGYNFLVDKYGRIYEGRAGGIDRPVVGAQAQGFNSQSAGIANIGDHSSLPQSGPALDALAALIRWKLPLHGAPTSGTVEMTSAGGASNRWAAGTVVRMNRISGHRDGNNTACPGDALYAQLPDLRARVGGVQPVTSALPPVALSLNRLASHVRRGKLARFTGTVDPHKAVVYMAAERKEDGRYRQVGSVRIRVSGGQVSTRFRPMYRAMYRFRLTFAGDSRNTSSVSRWVYVRSVKRVKAPPPPPAPPPDTAPARSR